MTHLKNNYYFSRVKQNWFNHFQDKLKEAKQTSSLKPLSDFINLNEINQESFFLSGLRFLVFGPKIHKLIKEDELLSLALKKKNAFTINISSNQLILQDEDEELRNTEFYNWLDLLENEILKGKTLKNLNQFSQLNLQASLSILKKWPSEIHNELHSFFKEATEKKEIILVRQKFLE